MKRTLLQRGAIIAACAAAFVLGGCGDTEFDSRTDTVYSLETPQVTAKAYPGVNVVSWKPVTGANGYAVTVYEEGVYKWADSYTTANTITDTKLANGKTYTYYVEAKSTTNPGTLAREVYATNSRGEASVKAIVPPLNTKALDLAAYEGGYDGKNVKTASADSDQWVVSSKNIEVDVADDKVYVKFPIKAYLNYTVEYYNNDLLPLEINKVITPASTSDSDLNANNALGQVSFAISSAGKYKIVVEVSAYNTDYKTSSEVVRGDLVTIETLDLTYPDYNNSDNLSAEYIFAENKFITGADKNARVWFTPAKKKNGEFVEASWYKVYRRVAGEYENLLVGDAVKESTDNVNNTKYYIYDDVPNVTKDYVYTVVVSYETKYGTAAETTLTKKTKGDITGLTPAVVQDDNKVILSVTVDGVAKGVTPTSAKYLVVQTNRVTPVLAQEIIDNGTVATLSLVADSDPKTYKAELTDLIPKDRTAYVYMVVQATLDGYNATTVIAQKLITR